MTHAPTFAIREIVAAHARLRDAITTLGATLRRSSGGTIDGAVGRRLLHLRRQLAPHFREEEESGLFDELEEGAPELAAACARLRRDHVEILRRFDRLQIDGRRTMDAAASSAWRRSISELLDDLEAHEQRENALLTDALAPDRGAPD
jgi:hypothetical protein